MKNNVQNKKKKTKQPANAPIPVVIQKIDVRPVNRTTQDIPKWRNAIKAAEAQTPRRNLLYDLYADVIQDGHVLAVMGKRIDAVTNANWQFVNKDGEAVDEINELIDSIGFDELLEEIVNSKFWGYSILEPTFHKGFNGRWEVTANLLPRLNYRPEIGVVAYNYASDEGVNIREGRPAKTVMEVGKPTDLGLLASAAQYAVLKRGGVGDYAMYCQVFGRPILDATWDGFDEKQRLELQAALDIGAGGQIIRPDGTSVNIIESKGTNTTIHQDFLKFLNNEISKGLLGTTETVESSSSSGYAQAKEHGEQDSKKHNSDITFTRKVLNSRFIRILEAHGFNTQGGKFVNDIDDRNLTLKEEFEIDKALVKEMNLPIDDDHWYEKYKIPKPDNYDQLKREKAQQQPVPKPSGKQNEPPKEPEPTKKKEKVQEKEVNLAMATKEEEKNAVKKIQAIVEKFIKKLFQTAPAVTTGASNGSHHTINLNFDNSFNNEALIKRFYDAKGKRDFDFELFKHTVKSLLNGFKSGWSAEKVNLSFSPSFEYSLDDPELLTAFEQNIFKFAGAKNLAEAQLLNELFRNAKSFEEFYQLAKARVEVYNKDWLLTEYNTAVLTGEAAATYHRLMAQSEIFPYWKYTTAGDDHVRNTHHLLEGVVLPFNDKRWQKLFPPNGWNCRCYVVPRMRHEFDASKLATDKAKVDAYLKSPAFAKEKAQGWGVNRGEIGQIFTANQQYVHKLPNMASKLLNKLGAADFNLKQYSQAKKVATATTPAFNNTADQFFNKLEILNENPVLRDYNKKPLTVEKKNFEANTTDSTKKRTALLNAMQEAVNTPDEVWLNGDQLEAMVYVKYFKDQTIVTTAEISKGKLKLKDWFTLKEQKAIIANFRRGLLVYSKK